MKTRVHRWGNSLAVRIPKTIAQDLGLTSGSGVEISVRDGSLVLEPAQSAYTLEELVRGITNANRHEEVDLGPTAGRERL